VDCTEKSVWSTGFSRNIFEFPWLQEIGMQNPTHFKDKFQRSACLASKIRQFYQIETAKKGTR
jgi:hypothetical protein